VHIVTVFSGAANHGPKNRYRALKKKEKRRKLNKKERKIRKSSL